MTRDSAGLYRRSPAHPRPPTPGTPGTYRPSGRGKRGRCGEVPLGLASSAPQPGPRESFDAPLEVQSENARDLRFKVIRDRDRIPVASAFQCHVCVTAGFAELKPGEQHICVDDDDQDAFADSSVVSSATILARASCISRGTSSSVYPFGLRVRVYWGISSMVRRKGSDM